jgi:DNA-binding NarL/FixJ family response regulator
VSEGPRALRVLVAGRHPVVRAGLRGLLANADHVEVVGEATSADDLDALARDLHAEVILLEWTDSGVGRDPASMGDWDVPVLLMGAPEAQGMLDTLLAAGARGFLLQDASGEEVVEAAHAVARGLVVVDAALAPTALSPRRSLPSEDDVSDPLTDRERQVLELLALGLPNKTIAQRLQISEHTVKFHVGSVLAKLGAASRTEAVAIALRRGLLAL